jgi:hypothetical protein
LTKIEQYEPWVKDFDESIGYCGPVDLTNAQPIEILSLFSLMNFGNYLQQKGTDML